MFNNKLIFQVRINADGPGYVIDAVWPDGIAEQLLGVYITPADAARWVNERAESWLRERLKLSLH